MSLPSIRSFGPSSVHSFFGWLIVSLVLVLTDLSIFRFLTQLFFCSLCFVYPLTHYLFPNVSLFCLYTVSRPRPRCPKRLIRKCFLVKYGYRRRLVCACVRPCRYGDETEADYYWGEWITELTLPKNIRLNLIGNFVHDKENLTCDCSTLALHS